MPCPCWRARRFSKLRASVTTRWRSASRLSTRSPRPLCAAILSAYLQCQLETATTLGLDDIGLPISSDPIESLFGLAKQHGVGEIKDADRIALRLPALCGTPTREEAEQVLEISVAEQTRDHRSLHLLDQAAA